MRRSGLADSPFFTAQPKQRASTPPSAKSPTKRKQGKRNGTEKPDAVKTTSNRDTTTPRHHDTTVSWYRDTIIELIRKAVKEFGKEAATHRFTAEEKKAIADIIYAYKSRGVRTSENEIARIAVNFVVNDYRENGENSVLDRALRALNG